MVNRTVYSVNIYIYKCVVAWLRGCVVAWLRVYRGWGGSAAIQPHPQAQVIARGKESCPCGKGNVFCCCHSPIYPVHLNITAAEINRLFKARLSPCPLVSLTGTNCSGLIFSIISYAASNPMPISLTFLIPS